MYLNLSISYTHVANVPKRHNHTMGNTEEYISVVNIVDEIVFGFEFWV